MNFKSFKKNLYNELKSIKIESLLSLSTIGSFQYKEKLSAMNDIDLFVLVDKLTRNNLDNLIGNFQILADKLNEKYLNEDIVFVVESRNGALKPSAIPGKTVVQLHLIIYDKKSWEDDDWLTWVCDINNFNVCLQGKEPKYFKKIEMFGKNNLLFDLNMQKEGLNSSSTIAYSFDSNMDMVTEEIPLSESEQMDNLCYMIITSTMNYIRLENPKFLKDQKKIIKFGKKSFDEENFKILILAYKLKEQIVSGKKVEIELEDFRKLVSIFIDNLIKKLN